jgi:predicted ArsR family transcriptional regulator
MADRALFKEIESRFSDVPLVRNLNVFLATEYAQNVGIRPRTARERLQRLASEGLVRRVRTVRNGKVAQAWEVLGKRGTRE